MKYELVITPLTGIVTYRKDIQRDCFSSRSKADDTGEEQDEYIHDGGGRLLQYYWLVSKLLCPVEYIDYSLSQHNFAV